MGIFRMEVFENMNSLLTSLGITNSRTRPQNTQIKSNSATSIKYNTVKKSAHADTVHISEEGKMLLQSGENHIHNPTEYENPEVNGLIANHKANMKNQTPQTRQFSHSINLGTDENHKRATIEPDQIFITKGNDLKNMTHTLLDISQGMDGINSNTMEMLKYTQLLVQGMNNGTGNGNPNVTGRPHEVLNALVFNISMTFGEISVQSGTNNSALKNAFRNMVLSLFDDASMSLHGQTEDSDILAGLRTGAKHMGNTFVNRFFSEMSNITSQNLRDTGLERAELAFHQTMNYTLFETGMAVLGDTSVAKGFREQTIGLDGKWRDIPTEEEFRRATTELMSQVMRETAEIHKQWAEMNKEEAEKWRMIMLIASRISSGANVPQQDMDFLMQNSPGMYLMAISSRAMAEDNEREYESITGNSREDNERVSSANKHESLSNQSTPLATVDNSQ